MGYAVIAVPPLAADLGKEPSNLTEKQYADQQDREGSVVLTNPGKTAGVSSNRGVAVPPCTFLDLKQSLPLVRAKPEPLRGSLQELRVRKTVPVPTRL